MNLHKLLDKQVKKYLPPELQQHNAVQKLLGVVSGYYDASERDKELSDRVFSISEEDYIELNEQLNFELKVKRESVEKLREIIATITGELQDDSLDDLVVATRFLDEQVNLRKKTENELAASQELWQFALEGAGDGVWRHNFLTNETFYSKQYKKMLGYEDHEFANCDSEWLKRIHPDDLAIATMPGQDYSSERFCTVQREYRLLHKNGHYIWILDRGMILTYTDTGGPEQIVGTHTDITSIKNTQMELAQRVKQFRSLSENIPGVIYEYEFRKDGTEGLRYVSPAMEKIFGIRPSEFHEFQKYIHPDDLPVVLQKNNHSRETLEPFYDEARIVVPGRPEIWHAVTSSFSYFTEDGSTVFTGFMLDITERKNVQTSLARNEEKYRNIIANMNLGLIEVDLNETIQSANQSFCNMSGYALPDIIGVNASDLFIRSTDIAMMKERHQKRSEGKSDAYELLVKNNSGEDKWWLVSGAPRYNDAAELVGSIGIHLDITNQKKLEYELHEAREQAESSAMAKQTFLANMSHEIRTPMNAILGMSRQLQKTTLDLQQQSLVDIINRAGSNLLIIVNDILDISKIEAGKLSLETIGFSLANVVNTSLQVVLHRAEEKGLLLTSNICDHVPGVLLGDPFRLNQVLLNLLSNAIKFSTEGVVKLDCHLTRSEGNRCMVNITVTDNGIGMDSDFAANLFKSFAQEDKSISRKFGGSGLGLTISKQLTELMGGNIMVTSKKNVGTSVTLHIPYSIGTKSDLVVPDTNVNDYSILKGRTILLVEDNEMNRLVATATLAAYEPLIIEANNGSEAIDILRHQHADLVLMDMQMPVMGGLEAAKFIREELKLTLPIIALTANAIKGESDKCFAAGMNDFIAKPFEEIPLVAMVAKWLLKHRSPTVAMSLQEMPLFDLSKISILGKNCPVFQEKIISLFIDEARKSINQLLAATSRNDVVAIKSISHKIKPSIVTLNIKSLEGIIAKLEHLPPGSICEDYQSMVKTLTDTLGQVISSLLKLNC